MVSCVCVGVCECVHVFTSSAERIIILEKKNLILKLNYPNLQTFNIHSAKVQYFNLICNKTKINKWVMMK